VTGDLLAARLAEHGLPPDEIDRKRALFDSVVAAFQPFAGSAATHAWWIPGRLEVFGKHTDYGGGRSIVGAVPRGFALIARARPDGAVRVRDAGREQTLELDPPFDGYAFTGWRHYTHVVARRLSRNFSGARIGADIVMSSDLPSASGMSSSSALVVGLVAALSNLAGLRDRPEWRENVRSAADEAGYYASFENGLSFGTLGGDAGVGTHGGSEDHAAIVCGAPERLRAWRFVPIEHLADVRVPDAWTFVIASSGVRAQKTGLAKDAYNRVADLASAVLETWNRSEQPQASLRAALMSDPSAPDRLRQLIDRNQARRWSNADLRTRLDHFVKEDARIPEALEAFRQADRATLTALADASQADAETQLKNQVPETIALARLARERGAIAASAFGAGFGGSVWALVDRADGARFASDWLRDYRNRFPDRSTATTFVARPGAPLTRLM